MSATVVNTLMAKERTKILEPLPDRIIMKIDKFQYHGRLVIPQTAQRMPTTGVVESVGDRVKDVKVGDHIVVPVYSGTLVKFAGVAAYRVLDEREILCKIPRDEQLELEDMGT